jgi:hypothetical protein
MNAIPARARFELRRACHSAVKTEALCIEPQDAGAALDF